MAADWTDKGIQRCVITDERLIGLNDLLLFAHGKSVFDIGCNRAHVGLEFARHHAAAVHGCDIDPVRIQVANHNFADKRTVEARFEVVDLRGGPRAVKQAFGAHYRAKYDFMLMLAVYHKLRREMPLDALLYLVDHFAHHTGRFFVWRGSDPEREEFEPVLTKRGFRLIHYSAIGEVKLPEYPEPVPQPAAVWLAS